MTDKLLIGLAGRGTINGEFASTARVGKDEVARVLKEDLEFRTYSFALPLKQTCQVLFGFTEAEMWNDKLKNVPIELWNLSPRTIFQRMGTEGGREIFDADMWAKMAMFVWDDVKSSRPYTLNHTATEAVLGDKPKTDEDFDFILHQAGKTMLQLSDDDIMQSLSNNSNLERWPFTFAYVKNTLKTRTIPAILDLPADQAWEKFKSLRVELPLVLKCSNGPYGMPPTQAKGLVVPDNRFDNEATIIRSHGGIVVHVRRELPKDIELVKGHASEQGVTPGPIDLFIDNNGTLDELRTKTHKMVSELTNAIVHGYFIP